MESKLHMSHKKFSIPQSILTIVTVAVFLLTMLAFSSAQAATTSSLSLSPNSQTVTKGSDLVVAVTLHTDGNSINTVQSILSYSSADFSLVSAAAGQKFTSFVDTPTMGSVSFTSGASTPVTSAQTVATITFLAKSTGTTSMSLAQVCSNKDYNLSCSAAYDSKSNANDLASVSNPESFILKASTSSTSTSANSTPIITDLQVKKVTSTSAVVSWHTNIAATSVVNYGFNTNYGLDTQSAAFVTTHTVTLNSPALTPSTTYYLRAISATSTGASSTSSTQRFITGGFGVNLVIHDNTGKPIGGAKIVLAGQTQTSNGAGVVSFQNVPAGPQAVTIKSGNKTTTDNVNVGKAPGSKGSNYSLQQFTLTASRGTISSADYGIVALAIILMLVVLLFIRPGTWRAGKINK
jgi:hypothetical protein